MYIYMHRAVSPIVATILLILISIAAGVMMWLWISGFISQAPPSQHAILERIKIDAVKVDTSKNQTIIYVRNMGSTDVIITSAYIYDVGNVLIEALNISHISIPPGAVKSIIASYTPKYYIGKSGYSFIIRVVTSNGVEASYIFVWP